MKKISMAAVAAAVMYSGTASAITYSNWVTVDVVDDSYGMGATLGPTAGQAWFNSSGIESCTDSTRVRIAVSDGSATFNRRLAMVLTATASGMQVRVRVNGCKGIYPRADLVQTRKAP